jgi:hypothetical protein
LDLDRGHAFALRVGKAKLLQVRNRNTYRNAVFFKH